MKKLSNYYIIIGVLMTLLATNCAKDKGNYDYQDVNLLTIVNDDGTALMNKDFDIRIGKQLYIKPKVTGSLNKEGQSQLSYLWLLGEDTVSREQILNLSTDTLGVGNKEGKLIVVDNQTTLSYSVNFRVRVTAGISKGSFIFTENEQHESTLVLRNLDAVPDYLYLTEFNGIALGKYPVNLDIAYTATSSTNREYVRFISTTKEGTSPIIVADLRTFIPSFLYPVDGSLLNGQKLEPTYAWCSPRVLQSNDLSGLVLVDGKCMNMSSGIIGEDVYRYDPLNYDFGENAVCPSLILNGYFLAGFDSKNERIRIFGNELKGGNTFTENFDKLVDPEETKGHQFIAVTEIYNTDWKWQFLTRKGSEIFMHNVMMDISSYKPTKVSTVTSKVVPQMVDAVHFAFSGNYWYFAKGRTIYQCSANGLDILPYLTLPNDGSGDIVAWNFDVNAAGNYTKIGIATYQSSATQDYKGSYYLYDMASRQYNQKDLHVIDKAVDIEIGL